MRIVNLCQKGCCPRVELGEDSVRIGEEGNLCTLRKEEWESLRRKILRGEL
jgi:hypothetical protein